MLFLSTTEITTGYPGMKVIVLSLHDDEFRVSEAIQSDAFSYLLKNDSPAHMVKQIEICNQNTSDFIT